MKIWLTFQDFFDALRNDQSVDDFNTSQGALAALNELLRGINNRSNSPSQTPPERPTEPSQAFLPPQVASDPIVDMSEDGLIFRYVKSVYRGQVFESDSGCPKIDQAAVRDFMDDIDRRLGPISDTSPTPEQASHPESTRKPFAEAADDYLDQYRRDREYDNTLRMSTYDKASRDATFWKHYFEGRDLQGIGIPDCREAEKHCRNYPKNVDAKVAAAMCRTEHGRPTTGAQATKTRLHTLKKVFAHAVKYGWISSNPTEVIDTKQRRGTNDVDKHPFGTGELQKIFPGASYGEGFFPKPTSREPGYDAAKFWTPLIALLSGARLGEIIQLELGDIKNEDGIWFFDITTESSNESSGKELKTKSSRRRVPIHSTLITIGLLDYVRERRKHPSTPIGLFDQYCRGAQPKGKKITEWFKGGPNGVDRHGKHRYRYGYLDRRGVACRPDQREDGSSVSFHSFRHTFADAARRGKLPGGEAIRDEDIRWILGHGSASMTSRYGHGHDMEFLKAMVQAVTYPEVDLDSIQWEAFKTKWCISSVNT
ncbi:tyrosine-type recombinase/integrase [Halomonas sediminis]